MNEDEFNSFFRQHSENVDNSNSLGFWRLTDEILRTYLLENMPKREGVTVVDLGGGTGRWLQDLDPYFKNSKFILVDLSKDMLAKAQARVGAGAYVNSIKLINNDISKHIDDIPDSSVDYIISTYNPLSFVDEPQKTVDEAFRVLKPNGIAQLTVQGYYNALFSKINNSLADTDELERIFSEQKVKWSAGVPKLWQLPKKAMENFFTNSGFVDVESRGIATVTQPQGEDFDPENKQLGALSKKLNEDDAFYDTLLKIELVAGRDQSAVDRAVNILTLGRKP